MGKPPPPERSCPDGPPVSTSPRPARPRPNGWPSGSASSRPPPTAIYASPLERAQETAAPIARALGLRVRSNKGLLDCAVGSWEGKQLKALAKTPEWRTVVGWPTGFRFPGGESFAEMSLRALNTVLSLAEEHTGERFVCVSHADPIKVDPGRRRRASPSTCSNAS